LGIVQNEEEPPDEPAGPPAGPDRYAFEPPPMATDIEFRRVRRAAAGSTAPSRTGRGRHPVRLWVFLGVAGAVLMMLSGLAWTGTKGLQAKGHLEAAAGLLLQLQQQLSRPDVTAAEGTLAALQAETTAARAATDGIGWSTSRHLPFVGDDLQAVRTLAVVLDDLASDGLPALLDVASGLDPRSLSPEHGRIDLTAVQAAAPRIATGLAVIRRARTTIADLRTQGLTPQLAAAVTRLSAALAKAERLVTTANRAALLLPGMLGANGPRTYLLLFQNNAEVRATGGMPGAYIVVRADHGAVTIVDQGTAAGDLRHFDPPVEPLSTAMEALYTDRPAVFPADVNLTPDFPTAAGLVRAMYRKRSGVSVDGVMATDPVALSYLLRVTGPVRMPKGKPLTADNAVRVLLSEAYAKYPDPAEQDRYFAGAARAVFEALLDGQGSPESMLRQLALAAGQRRLLLWSADKTEEAALSGTVLAGRLPTVDGMRPTVGVFLNDGTGAKLSYYLTQSAALSAGGCEPDGTRTLRLRLTIGSTAPARGLPAYVTGFALAGRKYTSRTNVMVFSPSGGGVVDVRVAGKEIDFGTGLERDRGVGVITVDLPPGSKRTYDITVQTGILPQPGGAISPRLWTTPGVHPWRTSVSTGLTCGN
jgi:hypothetical protein